MAILIDEKKRVLVQGITGREGPGAHAVNARVRNERGRRSHARQRRTERAWRAGI